jgi:ectoine hydroxylase-related dioxygenase (phytanoyl-CoA dioxygenase family)
MGEAVMTDVVADETVEFFSTYGFVVLRGWLAPQEVADLRDEVQRALAENYELPSEQVERATGTAGYYLPMMGPKTPHSRGLVADRRLMGLAETLFASPVVPKPAKGILYRDASTWHCDADDPDLRAIKLVTYFQPQRGDTGALQVLPGSHQPEFGAALAAYRARRPAPTPLLDEAPEFAAWPGVALASEPGDVIAFDVRLWHASLFGRDRLQWSISYSPEPVTERQEAAVRDYVMLFLSAGHEYDRDAYPYLDPAWSGPDAPRHGAVLHRLCADRTRGSDVP